MTPDDIRNDERLQKALNEGAQQGMVLRKYFEGNKDVQMAFIGMSLFMDMKGIPNGLITKLFECFAAIYNYETKLSPGWVEKDNFFL